MHINVSIHRSAKVHFVNTGGRMVSGGTNTALTTTTDIGADEEAATLNIRTLNIHTLVSQT